MRNAKSVRRLALGVLMFVVPVASALTLAVATTDPDEGANIGGGLVVMAALAVGIALAGRAWVGRLTRRDLAVALGALCVVLAATYGLDSLESD